MSIRTKLDRHVSTFVFKHKIRNLVRTSAIASPKSSSKRPGHVKCRFQISGSKWIWQINLAEKLGQVSQVTAFKVLPGPENMGKKKPSEGCRPPTFWLAERSFKTALVQRAKKDVPLDTVICPSHCCEVYDDINGIRCKE